MLFTFLQKYHSHLTSQTIGIKYDRFHFADVSSIKKDLRNSDRNGKGKTSFTQYLNIPAQYPQKLPWFPVQIPQVIIPVQ